MNKHIPLFELLKNEGKLSTIWLYPAKETVDDPYEKTKTLSLLNPIPIKGLVNSISFEALRWKYYGNMPIGSKQIICDKKHINLLKIADKIKIEDNYYKTYKNDEKGFAVIEREDYIIAVLERKSNA